SMILNRLAANADELGSYMRYLKTRTDFTESEYRQRIREKNDIIEDLRNRIDALQIDHEQKRALTSSLNELRTNRSHEAEFAERFPWLENFMESNLFKDITDRISTIVNSDEFRGIELSDTDIQLLSNAQHDLMRLVDSPEMMAEVMKQRPILETLKRIESGDGSDKPAADDEPEIPARSDDPPDNS
ncbi:MAG TPA: hypothetical protein VMW73_03415, partial [Spirochaetia bacterium]|nr:hypothetical protein [Spirochaetia bacterium]